jgi:hypothetical protein
VRPFGTNVRGLINSAPEVTPLLLVAATPSRLSMMVSATPVVTRLLGPFSFAYNASSQHSNSLRLELESHNSLHGRSVYSAEGDRGDIDFGTVSLVEVQRTLSKENMQPSLEKAMPLAHFAQEVVGKCPYLLN